MSLPIFKDFDKAVTDLLNDDFDNKYSLKIKTPGPCGAVVTTNTTFDAKTKTLEPKLTTKYSHSSGFTVEKLEISSQGRITTETSLVNAAPGLKLEFKGNDTDKGDLSFTYAIPSTATITGEVDALNLSKASASLTAGSGPFVAGASVDLKIAKSAVENVKFGLGFGYTVPKSLFAGVRVSNSLTDFSGLFSYVLSNELTLIGKVNHSQGAKASTTSVIGGVYKYGPNTTLKIKTSSDGVINASVKQQLDKAFSVVGSAEIPTGVTNGYKFGVNATLG